MFPAGHARHYVQEMTDIDDLSATLPIDQMASQLGEDPDAVRRAVDVALPALFGGLHANAADPAGATSLIEALGQHHNDVATAPVNVDDVDQAEGQKIASHIFGAQEEQVVQQLGATAGGSGLVAKVLPLLAPIVLSYLAKQMGARGGSAAGAGVLGTVLSSILSGAAQGSGGSTSGAGAPGGLGGILGGVLGGLLGGGRKA